MLTQTRRGTPVFEPSNLPEVEYPEEVIDRWNKEFEILEMQIAIGQRAPKSVAELMAERGIKL